MAETQDESPPEPARDAAPSQAGGAPRRHRKAHTTARDLERYAGLFAQRTSVMRSSAMRDLMEITARPDVISLAGGLPDTSTFSPQSFARQMTKIAQESSAEALQYGPTEGFASTKECIRQVMAAEGMDPDPDDIVVTTGGQQAIDLMCKALVDPGDIVIAEAPTYPGAVPVFCSYEAETVQVEMDSDGMRVDVLEETLDRLAADGRRPKLIYTVPSFRTRPARRSRSSGAGGWSRSRASVSCWCSRTTRTGSSATRATRSRPSTSSTAATTSSTSARSRRSSPPGLRLGWLCAPPPVLAKVVLGKQASDLCTSTLAQYFVDEFFAEGRWREYVDELCDVYRARRDAMLESLERHFPAEATWSEPEGGLFLWATLPDYIDTTDLLARALRENVAFVPASPPSPTGAPARTRCASTSPARPKTRSARASAASARSSPSRSRFTARSRVSSAWSAQATREGSGTRTASQVQAARLRCRPGGACHAQARVRRMKVAVLKGGRSLERQVSLSSGARVEDALAGRHDVVSLDAGQGLVERLKAEKPDVAFVALHGADGEDGTVQELLEILGIPYTGPGVSACRRSTDKAEAKQALASTGSPRRTGSRSRKPRSPSSAPPTRWRRSRIGSGYPLVVKPAREARPWACASPPRARTCRRRSSRPSPTTAASSWSATSRAGSCRSAMLEGEALPPVEIRPHDEDLYSYEARYEIGRTDFICPADLGEDEAFVGAAAVATWESLDCAGFVRVDLMLGEQGPEVLEVNAVPGLTDTSLFPMAAEAAGIGFEELCDRLVTSAAERMSV